MGDRKGKRGKKRATAKRKPIKRIVQAAKAVETADKLAPVRGKNGRFVKK